MDVEYDPMFDPHGHPEFADPATLLETVGSCTPTNEAVIEQEAPVSQPPTKKQKKTEPNRRAAVWSHYDFEKATDKNGKVIDQAVCRYCKKAKYNADPKYGTSNATHHLPKCADYKLFLAENPICAPEFDQKVWLRMFAEAIMFHSYPLSIVEHVKLRDMISYLQPQVRHVTRNTILNFCLIEHDRLKSHVLDSLAQVNSRISFTCDCWSACTSRGFLTLTAHYIDNNWTLKSRILNFRYFPPPHKGVNLYRFVHDLLKEWKLERKVFSITCDNATSMDVMISRLKPDLQVSSNLPCDGKYFHVRCCAHVLNLIVQAGMKVIDPSVLKIRAAVNYVAGSDSRKCEFEKCVVDSKCVFVGSLRIDCPTRWNSTYLMLKKALEAKDALKLLDIVDSHFELSLSEEEWSNVDFVCRFLKPFNDITELFSGSDYPTANLYFLNIFAIEKLLVLGCAHEVQSIQNMAQAMMSKFEKYWSEYCIILAVAFVLDPRYKLGMVRLALSKLYVESEVELKVRAIYDAVVDLYKFYDDSTPSSTSCGFRGSTSQEFLVNSIVEEFQASNVVSGDAQAAVDSYLNSVTPQNSQSFDVLKYWQSQATVFPVLSRMAKDILAIPITSVASESSFSMGSRILTRFRASMLTSHCEAFVTTQNWYYGYLKEEDVEECFELMKEIMPNDVDLESLPTAE